MSLAGSAARGAAVTVVGQVVRLATQMVALVVLARLLAPSDFGLVAMVIAIVGVGELISDFGLSNAAIQARDLTTQQRSNLFWASTLLGGLIALLVAVGSGALAQFYDQELLQAVAMTLACTFLINGMAAQYKASLARSLRFPMLAVIETLPAMIGAAVAIVLAVLGASYWALVAQQIAQAVLVLVLAVAAARWLPVLPRRTPGMVPLISYGAHLLGAQVVAYASRHIDTVVMGYRFGATQTGFYTRAFDLVMRPLNQINAPSSKVAIPVLSRLQDDAARYDAYLLRGQKALLAGLAPLLALTVAAADPLVLLLLGDRWQPVAPLLQVLAVAGLIRTAAYPTYWIALSRGYTNVSLYVNLATAPLYVGLVIAGSSWGPVGIAWGLVLAALGSWAISLLWYAKVADAPSRRLLIGGARIFAGVVPATVAAAVLVQAAADVIAPLAALAAATGLFVVVYALTVCLVPALRRDARDVWRIVTSLRSR